MLAPVCQRVYMRLLTQSSVKYSIPMRFLSDQQIPTKKPDSEVQEKPLYATKANYQKKVQEQRHISADIENGQRPTKWQRKFLVWTRLYQHPKDIPEIVANGTMNRMHDRLRVVFIVFGCFGFFSIFYVMEIINFGKISRDRKSGKVVTKME